MNKEKYEVTFLDRRTGNRWTATYTAGDFAEAESKAYDGAGADPDEIISIAIVEYED